MGVGGRADEEAWEQTPEVNSIMIERKYFHVGITKEILPNGVLIEESNFIHNWIDERFVPYSDILGYVYQ